MRTLKYTKGYKYQVDELHSVLTPVKGVVIGDEFFTLHATGLLVIRRGFTWDGASGPTFDTKNSMRASLVHDVFCICMRDGRLPHEVWAETVHAFFKEMCIADGMCGWRAHLWYLAVKAADAGNPAQGPDRQQLEAP